MAISSPGIGSNLDVNGIVAKLMAVESAPVTALQKKEASFLAKITAYGSVKGTLSSFQTAINSLSSASTFKTMSASSSDFATLNATASTLATPGNYAISITSLAQSQTLASTAQASTTAAVGSGIATTISFQFGKISGGALANGVYTGSTFEQDATQATGSVVINSTNNSLQGIRDAINAANVGATASIVNDGAPGSPYRLMLTSTSTGESKSIKITSSGGDAAVTSLLAYDPAGTQNFKQTVAAQNASLTVNGLAISSASNSVSDAISGVTMNLTKSGGATTNLTIANNTSAVTSAVQALVKSFNDTNNTLKSLTGYNATTKQGGILLGDSTMQAIQSKLRATMASPLSGVGGNTLTNMTQIGISFQKDGSLTLDNTKLQAAITNNFGDFAALFASAGKPTDSLVNFAGSTTKSTPGSYAVDVTSLATQGKAIGADKATQASLNGSIVADLTILDSTNDQLLVSVDGGAGLSVKLTAGTYANADALALQVETDINAALLAAVPPQTGQVTVTQSFGKLSINSASFGATSSVSVTDDPLTPANTGPTSLLGAPTTSRISTIKAGVNDQLSVSISGTSSTVTLAAGTYTATTLAAQIQAAINGNSTFSSGGLSVSVTEAADVLSVTSNRFGSTSAVNITGGSAFANLFASTATATAGTDVVGKINGVAALGSGQFLSGALTDPSSGIKLQVIGGAPGARGTVNFSQGYAYNLNAAIDSVLSSSGSIASNTDSANRNIADLKKRAEALNVTLSASEKRYRAQFTALDILVGKLATTSSFLTQQLASISNLSSQ